MKFIAHIKRMLFDRSGATGIEYGMIAAGIALVLFAALSRLDGALNNTFDRIAVATATASGGTTAPGETISAGRGTVGGGGNGTAGGSGP